MNLLSWPKERKLLYPPCPIEMCALAARRVAETVRVSIPGHPGYSVDGLGRIYSEITQRELKPSFADSSVRARVELRGGFRWRSGRKSQRFYVARLVLRTFKGPPPCSDCWICHVNGDKLDNRASNLKWCLTPLLRRHFADAQDIREVTLRGKNGCYYVDRFGNGWKVCHLTGNIIPYQFNTPRCRAYVVARAFLGVRPYSHALCFKDGNRKNLNVENLDWVPRQFGSGLGFFKLLQQQEQLKQVIENYDYANTRVSNGSTETNRTSRDHVDGRYAVQVTDYFG